MKLGGFIDLRIFSIIFDNSKGDTITSVAWKRSKYIFEKVLNPDTYTKSTFKQIKYTSFV